MSLAQPQSLMSNCQSRPRCRFLELGELFAKDALERNESCGGHFREESQTPEGEALRNDKDFTFVSAWEYQRRTSKQNCIKRN